MSNQKYLAEESIGKLLLKYSIPAIIGMLVNALYNIVDRMFIRRIPDVGSFATQIANSLIQVVANNALKTYRNDLAIDAMEVISSLNIVFMMPIVEINDVVIN